MLIHHHCQYHIMRKVAQFSLIEIQSVYAIKQHNWRIIRALFKWLAGMSTICISNAMYRVLSYDTWKKKKKNRAGGGDLITKFPTSAVEVPPPTWRPINTCVSWISHPLTPSRARKVGVQSPFRDCDMTGLITQNRNNISDRSHTVHEMFYHWLRMSA